jgi:hypothetical protein
MSDANKAVLTTAKEREADKQADGIYTLSTGVRARLLSVSPGLITDVQSRIKYPEVPKFYNDEKDRWEDNPNDPVYQRQIRQVDEERGMAALRAMCMFGFELVDGLPEDDTWIRKLELVNPDLEIDRDDPVALEFYYKQFVAVGAQSDYALLAKAMGVTQEAIAQAEATFQRDSSRNGNQ